MKFIQGKWFSYFSDLEYNVINDLTIDIVLNKFKLDVIDKLNDNTTILLQLKENYYFSRYNFWKAKFFISIIFFKSLVNFLKNN